MKTIQFCICTLTLLILTACSDGVSSSSGPNAQQAAGPNAQQGVFIDSAVEGVTYTTLTRSGTTDSNGTFVYLFGEVVTFSIGGITLGSAVGQPQLTPIDLVPGAIDATDQQVINILRFVQSLDADSDPSNGISIPAAAQANAAGQTLDFNQATVAFEADANALLALLYPLPALPPALVSEAAALAHFTGVGGAPQSAIVFTSTDSSGDVDLYLINEDGTGLTPLATGPEVETSDGLTAGGRVIYSQSTSLGSETDIYSVNTDGSGMLPVAVTGDYATPLAVTASGRLIFVRGANPLFGPFDIYSINADGSGQVQLTNTPAENEIIAGQALGERIVFTRVDAGTQSDIFSINADGSGQVQLTNTPTENEIAMGVLASGRVIYVRDVGGQLDLFSIPADGSGVEVTLATDTINSEDFAAEISGDRIIFNRTSGPQVDLYLRNADGSGSEVPIATDLLSEDFAGETPGGRLIFDRTNGFINVDIYAVDADGTNQSPLAVDASDWEIFANITADGRIIYNRWIGFIEFDMYSVNADGSGTTPIAKTTDSETAWAVTLGDRIIFNRITGLQTDLFGINSDGSGAEVILANDPANHEDFGGLLH
jgi:Tol biopolymer transport system component